MQHVAQLSSAALKQRPHSTTTVSETPAGKEPPSIVLRRLWERMGMLFGHKWVSVYGTCPQRESGELNLAGDTWARALVGLSSAQIGAGVTACLEQALEWPPSVGEFRALCLGIPTLAEVVEELRGGRPASPFGRLVWQHVDAYAHRHADSRTAERMVRDAYEIAHRSAVRGEPLPAPSPALEHTPPPRPVIPATREEREAKLAQIRAQLDP